MALTKVSKSVISDNAIDADKLAVTGNGNSGELLASSGDGTFQWTSGIATELYTDNAIAALVDSAPGALDTLNELAAALGDDANFSTTVTNALATKIDGTGTTNYVMKWLDNNTATNSVIYDDGTNVGIGTSSPASTLDIQGSSTQIIRIGNTGGVNGYQLKSNVSSSADFGFLIEDYAGIDLYKAQAGVSGSHHFYINGSEAMRITSTGNVGIGTSIPSVKLQVIENVSGWTTWIENKGTGAGNSGLIVTAGEDNGDNTLLLRKQNGTETFAVKGDGNVGIGTSFPSSTLEIAKNDQTNGATLSITNSFNGTGWTVNDIIGTIDFKIADSSTPQKVRGQIKVIHDLTGGTYPFANAMTFTTAYADVLNERMRIDSSGNVGIGTTTPSTKLQVAGTVTATALTETSALRFKENIQEDIDASIIDKLRPVSYDWKEDKKKDYGFIAEEVNELDSTLTTQNEDGEMLGIKYTKLIPFLVKKIQEQEERIKQLENGKS